jgi:hypothetical protein
MNDRQKTVQGHGEEILKAHKKQITHKVRNLISMRIMIKEHYY